MEPGIDIKALARELALAMDPEALLTDKEAAAELKVSARHMKERLSKIPGFPLAIRLNDPDGKHGEPLYVRREIRSWAMSRRKIEAKKPGRPRKMTPWMPAGAGSAY